MDFPQVCEVAETYIAQYKMKDRVKTHAVNIWQDHWPAADLHFFSNMFHDWAPDKCHLLTAKSFNSLKPGGGQIVVHEMLYNDEKTGPFAMAGFSMVMMGWTEGKMYSSHELTRMLDEVGFEDIQTHKTFDYHSIVTGIKP